MMDGIIFFQFVSEPVNFYTGCPVVLDLWIGKD
jgi:hypothetical protein